MKDTLVLGIESSCDETAAAVVKNGRTVLSNVISSQIAIHTLYGGVVPEIASRKHIEKYYNAEEIGKFPERLVPISRRPDLTDLGDAISYDQIYEQLMHLSLCVYTPSNYIFPSKIDKYRDLTHNKGESLTQTGREQGIRKLMSINLLSDFIHFFSLKNW